MLPTIVLADLLDSKPIIRLHLLDIVYHLQLHVFPPPHILVTPNRLPIVTCKRSTGKTRDIREKQAEIFTDSVARMLTLRARLKLRYLFRVWVKKGNIRKRGRCWLESPNQTTPLPRPSGAFSSTQNL